MARHQPNNVAASRGMVDHTQGGLGRDGRVPKRAVTDGASPVHGGMHSNVLHGGNLVRLVGVTHTSLLNAPDASGASPLDPTIPGKRLSPPMPSPGMRSRSREISPGDRGHVPDLVAEAHNVLSGAVLSGSTKLHDCDEGGDYARK